jgi:hypothetical protein
VERNDLRARDLVGPVRRAGDHTRPSKGYYDFCRAKFVKIFENCD